MGILLHAAFEALAWLDEHRGKIILVAAVGLVFPATLDDFRGHDQHGFARLDVHIALHGGPEAVNQIRAAAEQEDVEEQLGVEREHVGNRGMLGDESEERPEPVRFVRVVHGATATTCFSRAGVLRRQFAVVARVRHTMSSPARDMTV